MITASLAEITAVLGVTTAWPGLKFRGISTDSRTVQAGELFLALRGESFDGHRFIEVAFARGAVAVLVDCPTELPHLWVADTLVAYQALARWWRSRFALPVIGITGSVGKTSTKEMLAAALGYYGPVLKSAANHNNDIGVPQTLLQLNSHHQFAVLEMAMRGPGEIARLAATAQPTHGLITGIGRAHIGRLGSQVAIAKAKCELLASLDSGVAILNGEDALLLTTAAHFSTETYRFGLQPGTSDLKAQWQEQALVIDHGDHHHRYPVPLPGRHQAMNYLAALTTLHSLGLDLTPLQAGIQLDTEGAGRNQTVLTPDDITILDETYNAAPEAMQAALALLVSEPAPAYWAVLGPMRELGEAAPAIYQELGEYAATLPLSGLLLYDPEQELHNLGLDTAETFDTITALVQRLEALVKPGDRILCKAARSIQLERVIQQFKALPSRSS